MFVGHGKQWPQYLAAITATLSMAISGSHIGWTSPALLYLKSSNSTVSISSDDASWITSCFTLGMIPGCMIAAFIVDYYGRKRSLLLGGVPMLLGWILILIGGSPYILYASRFISGIGSGIVYAVCPMYIGEIADSDIRGALGSLIRFMVTFGQLCAHAVGPFVSYEMLVYACLVLTIIFFLTFVWMPETPYFLLMHVRRTDAENSLTTLKRYTSQRDRDADLELVNATVKRDLENIGSLKQLFATPGNRRAVIVSLGIQFILQFSGLFAIESNTQEIFELSDVKFPPGLAVIVLNVLQIFAGILAISLVDRMGRRPLLTISTSIAGLSLAVSAIYCYLEQHLVVDMHGNGWILVVSMMTYASTVSLGMGPVGYLIIGELFPTNIKGIAVSLTILWASMCGSIVVKFHQILTDSFGMYLAFGCFAMTCFLGNIFVAFYVPETKGKSLLAIQQELNPDTSKEDKKSDVVA